GTKTDHVRHDLAVGPADKFQFVSVLAETGNYIISYLISPISYFFSTPPVECGEINCGNGSRKSAKKFPVENSEIIHNRLWRKSACPVLPFSTFPHKILLLRLLLQKPMI
ncbi:MAG: hypothetical protein ACI3V1_02745, partial [Faecousia sp.]